MKYGMTVQQPPGCGSRCETFGNDMSYEKSKASYQSAFRYRTAERKPRAPYSAAYLFICLARFRNSLRLLKRRPSWLRSCIFTSKPLRRMSSRTASETGEPYFIPTAMIDLFYTAASGGGYQRP